eukprot:COSAG04_NODE_1698_length_5893_cov_5.841388_3_plen_239_part_00
MGPHGACALILVLGCSAVAPTVGERRWGALGLGVAVTGSIAHLPLLAGARRSKKKPPPARQPSAPSHPQSAAARDQLRLGKSAESTGDPGAAMGAYDRAVELGTADGDVGAVARAHGAAGRLLLGVGAGKDAAARFAQAIAADGTYAAGHLNLAHAHLTVGEHRRGVPPPPHPARAHWSSLPAGARSERGSDPPTQGCGLYVGSWRRRQTTLTATESSATCSRPPVTHQARKTRGVLP